jgi:hypothetical protein
MTPSQIDLKQEISIPAKIFTDLSLLFTGNSPAFARFLFLSQWSQPTFESTN